MAVVKTVNAHSTQTAGPAGGFLRAKTEKLKKVLRSILTKYPAGVYNQDTPMGYLKERGDRHGRMLLPEDQGPHGRGIQEPDEPAEPDRGPDPRSEGHAGKECVLPRYPDAGGCRQRGGERLLADHIRTCVAENIRAGNDEVIDELVRTMQKLMK